MTNIATIEATPEPRRRQDVVTTPSHLLAMAVEQGADLDKLEKLMALQERWEANEARKAFVAAMAAFKSEPLRIGKNKRVSFTTQKGKTEYDHAELSDVTDALVPAMAKHGLSHRWTLVQEGTRITVACVVTHSLGHSERVEMSAPPDDSGGKNSIQAIASTKTYLERYTLLAITGMATGGQDDDGRGGAPVPDYADWLEAIAQAADLPSLKTVKGDLEKAFPKVPPVLVSACNARLAAIKKAAQA